MPAPFLVEAFEAALAGDWARSGRAQAKATAVRAIYQAAGSNESLFQGVIGGIKAALNLLGVQAGQPAAPLRPCTHEEIEAIGHILRDAGLLS